MKLIELTQRELNVILLLIILISPILGISSEGLATEPEDTLCFELSEAKNLLKYAEKGYFCDTLTFHYEKKDSILRKAIDLKDEEIQLAERLIQAQIVEIDRLKRKIKWFKIGCISLGSGFIVASIVAILK